MRMRNALLAGVCLGVMLAAGAFAVLRENIGLPRNVPAEMAREHARVKIVAAADREADGERDGLAAIELLDALGMGVCGAQDDRDGTGGRRSTRPTG